MVCNNEISKLTKTTEQASSNRLGLGEIEADIWTQLVEVENKCEFESIAPEPQTLKYLLLIEDSIGDIKREKRHFN